MIHDGQYHAKYRKDNKMASLHSKYKYSATVYSEDLAVVNCLRALAQFSQKTGNNRIPWGGTKDEDWKRDGSRVTFRFTNEEYRTGYLNEIRRLLPQHLWSVTQQNDNDPAKPQ
jgi:hypothetical protein